MQQHIYDEIRRAIMSPEAKARAENGDMDQVAEMALGAAMRVAEPLGFGAVAVHRYEIQCVSPSGSVRWEDSGYNLTTNAGLDEILDKFWKGSAYSAAHYVGLTAGSPTFAAGDTMASHGGWTEVTAYSEGARQTLTLGSVSGQSVDNSASKAVYSINGTATIGGGFISTDSTKSGTTGILIGGAAFDGGNRSAQDGDTLNVTTTLTQASA